MPHTVFESPHSPIHNHKQIIVLDNGSERSHQMATVLSFVGEHFFVMRSNKRSLLQKYPPVSGLLSPQLIL